MPHLGPEVGERRVDDRRLASDHQQQIARTSTHPLGHSLDLSRCKELGDGRPDIACGEVLKVGRLG